MEETNYPRLCQSRKDAIADSIQETIEKFSDHLPPENESLCFYYASIGWELCRTVYDRVFQNSDYYTFQCGQLSVQVSLDPDISSRGVNFGANGANFEKGNFHCWLIGNYKASQSIQSHEFIDFTSRFYGKNAEKQGHKWTRSDIGNYIWIGQNELEQIGIRPSADEVATDQAFNRWLNYPFKDEMYESVVKDYQLKIKGLKEA